MNTHLSSNIAPTLPEIVGAKGIILHASNGKKFYDLSSQTLNLALGHGHPAIVEPVRHLLEQENFTYFTSSRFQNKYVETLADELVRCVPAGLSKVNLKMCNGSDANEDAFKRCRKQTGKNMIVSLYRSHLGVSSETLAASGKHFGKRHLGGSGNFLFIDPCYEYRKHAELTEEDHINERASQFEQLCVKRGDIAAIVIELLQVDGGVLVQPKSYVQRIEKICREHGCCLIFDEVQTAFGWWGKMFACEAYGITPDVLVLGKALAGGFPSLAATVFKPEFDNLDYGESEYTNGASVLCCAAAVSNLKYLTQSGIMDTVQEKHDHITKRLKDMQQKYSAIGDVRGSGLIFGIEFVNNDGSENYAAASTAFDATVANGVVLRKATCSGNGSNVLIIKPPIIITHEEIDKSMTCLDNAFRTCLC